VREQALHPPCWTGLAGGEEDKQGPAIFGHSEETFGRAARVRWMTMGGWYWIGVSVGLGAAAGVLVSSFAARMIVVAVVIAAAAGVGLGYAIDAWQPGSWGDLAGGAAGGLGGAFGAVQIVRGALRRGGTVGGTAALVAGAALVVAGLAWIPVVGYLEALALPALALRLRRRAPERYAGLRTLAK
jgi:hypothetical protein